MQLSILLRLLTTTFTFAYLRSRSCSHVFRSDRLLDVPVLQVLHLVFDDARPEMKAYGQSAMITPTIDALAASGRSLQKEHSRSLCVTDGFVSLWDGQKRERRRNQNLVEALSETRCSLRVVCEDD